MAKRIHKTEFNDVMPKKHKRWEEETNVEKQPGDLSHFIKDPEMVNHLKAQGIMSLFPIQQSTFHLIVKGQDLTARDRTGSGKTLAYSLPSLQRLRKDHLLKGNLPKVLVIVPTRELALQVTAGFQKISLPHFDLRVLAVYGGDGMQAQLRSIQKGADIVVATPGRLIDFINRGAMKLNSLECVVLDQADEMLKQGFEQDIEKVFKAVREQRQKKPQTLLFSATLPPWVQNISRQYQSQNCTVIDLIGTSAISVPTTIKHMQVAIRGRDQIQDTVSRLCKRFAGQEGRCIVFCETKNDVRDLCETLGGGCKMLHGDVRQSERQMIYREFKKGTVRTIVATNVAARGLDFPNIQLVIQVEPPRQLEAYIHRAGRTGRAGKEGTCVLLVQKKYRDRLESIQQQGGFRFENLNPKDI